VLCRPLLCVLACDTSFSCRYCIISPARCRLRRPSRRRRPATPRLRRHPFCDIPSLDRVLARRAVRCADRACGARPPQHLGAGVLGDSRLPPGVAISRPSAVLSPSAPLQLCRLAASSSSAPPLPGLSMSFSFFARLPAHATILRLVCTLRAAINLSRCRSGIVGLDLKLEAAPRACPPSPTRAARTPLPSLDLSCLRSYPMAGDAAGQGRGHPRTRVRAPLGRHRLEPGPAPQASTLLPPSRLSRLWRPVIPPPRSMRQLRPLRHVRWPSRPRGGSVSVCVFVDLGHRGRPGCRGALSVGHVVLSSRSHRSGHDWCGVSCGCRRLVGSQAGVHVGTFRMDGLPVGGGCLEAAPPCVGYLNRGGLSL